MPEENLQSLDREERLDEAVTAFLEEQESGRRPRREDWLTRYPEVAAELEQFFTDQDEVDRLTGPLRTALHAAPSPDDTPHLRPLDNAFFPLSPSMLATPPLRHSATPPLRHSATPPEGYELLQVLGKGGMGLVYKARQKSAGRLVALKLIRTERLASESDVQRFRNEAEAAAQLDHPHIVPVYEVGARSGHFFFSMKLIEGGGLDEQLERFRDDLPGAVRLVAQVARAVHHAHQRGILHRDLKPSNILLDREGQPHVSDFGLAKRIEADGSLTQTGAIVGTPQYMAPEQTSGRKGAVTTATDVYGLGAVLYALLTGKPPFRGETVLETLEQVRDREPEPPSKANPRIDRELEAVCLKCLDKDSGRRYASPESLAEDLERWLRGEPVAARPAGWAERLWRWMRRHRLAVGAAVGLLLALTVVTGSIGWVARDRAARRAATAEVVSAAQEEADSWQQQRRLSEALSAARRAAGLIAGADVEETLQQKVHARLADLELLDRLESIRLEQATAVRAGRYDFEWVDGLYRKTFLDAGLDFEGLQPEEAGERIRKTTVAVELATILDDWAPSCKEKRGKKDQSWKHLLRVARAADPDSWRMRIREAIEREDWKALRQIAVSDDVFRLPPATLSVVGSNLLQDAETDRAIEAFLRAAQRRYPNDYWLNHNLYKLYSDIHPPNWDEQIRFAAAAVVVRPDSLAAHNALGNALLGKGRLDESIAEYREAIRLKPDEALGHNNLGAALGAQRRHEEAIAEYREAIRLDPSYAKAHHNLGGLLGKLGRREEGIAETREALRLNKDFTEARYNLANFLGQNGQLDEAIVEYRETIRLRNGYAEAHCNLGRALQRKGQFAESLVSLRRGHELGTKNLPWRYPSARWVQECQRLLELDRKLPAILSGKQQPADGGESLALAKLCQLPCKKLYVAALRFFEEAFAADPKLIGDQPSELRYNAACAAALAGCGQGEDAKTVDDNDRARLRRQAVDWLRADLAAWRKLLEKGADKARPAIAGQMQHWLQDADFTGVRGTAALGKLPETERQPWQKLWEEVEAVRRRAAQQPSAASSARP